MPISPTARNLKWVEGPHRPQRYSIQDAIEIKAYFVTPYDNSLGSPKIYSINKKLEKIRKDVDALIALKKSGTKFAGRLSFTCFASWPRPSTFNLVKKLTSHIEEYFADYDNHTFRLDKVDEEGTICTLGVAI